MILKIDEFIEKILKYVVLYLGDIIVIGIFVGVGVGL